MGMSIAACHLGVRRDTLVQLPVVVAALLARPAPHLLLGDLNLERSHVEVAPLTLLRSDPTFPAHRPTRTMTSIAVGGIDAVELRVLAEQPVSDHRPRPCYVQRTTRYERRRTSRALADSTAAAANAQTSPPLTATTPPSTNSPIPCERSKKIEKVAMAAGARCPASGR